MGRIVGRREPGEKKGFGHHGRKAVVREAIEPRSRAEGHGFQGGSFWRDLRSSQRAEERGWRAAGIVWWGRPAEWQVERGGGVGVRA